MPWRWILAFVWLVAWGLAANGFWGASREHAAEAELLSRPVTGVVPGEARLSVSVGKAPSVRSPFTHKDAVAVVYWAFYNSTYLDSQDKTQFDSQLIGTRPLGPPDVKLEAGDSSLLLPLQRFNPDPTLWVADEQQFDKLPPDLGFTAAEIDQAKAKARSNSHFRDFSVEEYRLEEGASFFIAGVLRERDEKTGLYRIEPDPALKRVVLFRGTQSELVAKRAGSSKGLRIAGWILLVLGFLPTLAFTILAIRKRLSKPAV